MLSVFLEEPDIELAEVKVEQVILNKVGERAIRLDVWAKSRDNRQFNMEMQNDTKGDDGTTKIFLNMSSKKGAPELVRMLQYIKKTDIKNPEIQVCDARITAETERISGKEN